MNTVRLNLGCGGDIRNGYVNIDFYHQDPRITKANIEELHTVYQPNSVDEIVASDVIEHISHRKVTDILKMWISLLKPGGTIYIKTPDIRKQLECFTNGTWNPELLSYMVFGGQENDGNYHKCCFTMEYLSSLLESYGMKITSRNVEHFRLTNDVRTSANANLIVCAVKGTSIGTSPESSGLGDILLLTALCKHIEHPIVELTPTAAQRFGCLFDGIATVVVTNTPTITKDVGNGTFVERKLRSLGLDGADPLPKIKITDKETEWARRIMAQYNNPIIFVPNTALRNKHQREFDIDKWQRIIDHISKTRTVIQFGISNNFTLFKNTIVCKDLEIRKTAALYSVVKEYIGVDTGDMHLMLSVGGKVTVLVPESRPDYQHEWWHYKSPLANYIPFKNYEILLK